MSTDSKTVWSSSIEAEIGYWHRTIEKDPGQFARRFERVRPGNQMLPGFVSLVPSERVELLDVGCGPAPAVIGKYSKQVEITACDPLADHYQDLLDRHGIRSPVRLVKADGEELVAQFGSERFDIVHIRNALDHSYRPVDIVRNMVRCAKPGGLVMIRTVIEEGANEGYHGLHQWDIYPGAGDFYIRHRDGDVTAVRAALGEDIDALLLGTHSSFHNAELQDWLDVVLIRKGASTRFVAQVENEFYRVQLELGRRPGNEKEGLEGQIAQLRREISTLKQSTAYQLGQLLIRARRSPSKLITLPRDVLRLRGRARQSRGRPA
jgi:SAM-dependent methyltransferase